MLNISRGIKETSHPFKGDSIRRSVSRKTFTFASNHRDEIEVPNPLAVKDLISYNLHE